MSASAHRSRKKPSVTRVQTVTDSNGKEVGYIQPWDGGQVNVYAIIPGTGRHEHVATINDPITARGSIERYRSRATERVADGDQ